MSTSTRQFNPFPGLRTFNTEEDYLFFGREEQVTELLKLLRQHRFIAVVGTSGSGKSSLVRAGLLPALHGGTMTQAGSRWEVLLLRPGGDPITNLARSFLDADLYDPDDEESLPRLKATLNRSRLGLVEAVKQSDISDGSNLLIVVDQFEELFRFRQTSVGHQETAGAFVKLLLAASQQDDLPIFITITMRSDYLGECAEVPGLAEAVNDGEYLIPRLKREQRRAAIEMPVSVGGGKIAARLVQKLLNDVGDDSDQLPVLQHALMRIWEDWAGDHQDDEPLDLRHYESVGGLHEALSHHADEVFADLPNDRLRVVAEKSFKALTERGPDNRGIRRPTRLDHLCAIVAAEEEEVEVVVNAFRQAGRTFLMPMDHVALSPETVVDISHESLMRVWQRLSRWVEDESQSARVYRRLADTALLHAEGKAGVYHDPDLNIALTWRETSQPTEAWADRYHAGFEQAMAFLDQSSEAKLAAERQREEVRQRELARAKELAEAQRLRAEEQQRSAKRLKGLLVVMAFVAVFAMGAFFVALAARRDAQKNAELAYKNAKLAAEQEAEAVEQAERAQANEALARANEAKAREQEQLAEDRAETIRKSLYVSEINGAGNAWQEAFGIERVKKTLNSTQPKPGEPDLRGWEWYHLLSLCQREELLIAGGGALISASWSPDGSKLVAGLYSGSVRVWDAHTAKLLANFDRHNRIVWSVCWSPDGQRFASASGDRTVRIWNVNTLEEDLALRGHTSGVRSVAWSPDGLRLATASNDHTARIWDLRTGRTIHILLGHTDGLHAIKWNSDGTRLATASSDNSIKIWDSSGTLLQTILGHADTVRSLAWSPDDRYLASSGADRTAHVWDIAAGESLWEIPGETQWNTVAWSPSGEYLVTSVRGSVDIYEFATRRRFQRFNGHQGQIRAIDWSAEGDQLLTASFDGNAKIWRVGDARQAQNGQEHLTLAGHGQIRDAWLPLAWSLDGTQLATADADGVIRIWEAASGQQTSSCIGHTAPVRSLAWHPDGQRLASGSEDRSVRIWQVADSVELETIRTNTDEVRAVAWSPDGQRLAWGSADTTVSVWSPGFQDQGISLFMYGTRVLSVAWSPDSTRLAAVGGESDLSGAVKVWEVDAENQAEALNVDQTRNMNSVAWNPDGTQLAIGGADGDILLLDAETGDEIASLVGLTNEVDVVAWSPDGTRLASVGDNSLVHIWDVATGRELLALQGHQGPLDSVAWRPDGFQLASGGNDGTVKIWDATAGYVTAGSPLQLPALTSQIVAGADNAVNRRTRGEILANTGDWDQAAADFERAAELAPEAGPLFQTGWWAAGPYPQDVLAQGPLDAEPDPFGPPPPSELAEADENTLFWHSAGQQPDGHLDFRQLDVSGDNVVSLAVTRVFASSATEVVAFSGDDDRLNMWLNGELVHESAYDGGGAAPDQDVFLVTLRQGWNTLLFAVENGTQGHGMFFRLSEAPLDLAQAYIAAGRIRAAVELVEQASAADPANTALSLKAADLFLRYSEMTAATDAESARRYRAQARDIYQEALNRQPNSTSIARRLAALLVERKGWSVIQPLEVTSEGGATLTVLPDASVLAGGDDPATDTYTIVAETDQQGITGFLIEALPHESLPQRGPGRSGNFVMSGIELSRMADGETNEDAPIAIADVEAEFHQLNEQLLQVLNPNSPKGWGIWPRTGVPTAALFKLSEINDGRRFKIKLHFHGDPNYPNHTLGRFRLAVTNSPDPHIAESIIAGDSSVGVILGSAYFSAGDIESAVSALQETIARNAGGIAEDHLLLATAYLRLGETQDASAALERAVASMRSNGADTQLLRFAARALTEAIENGLDDARWWELRAIVRERLGRRVGARSDYEAAMEREPTNSQLADRITFLTPNVVTHWDFDFAADDWAGVDGAAISPADGSIRVRGPGDLRSIAISSQLEEGWKLFSMRVRSPDSVGGRIQFGSTSQPFDIPASENEWHELRLFLNTSVTTNDLQLDFAAAEAPLEIDRIAIATIDLADETEEILAQFNERAERYPGDAQVFIARARLFGALGKPDDAKADYARAYQLATDDPEVLRELSAANLSFDSSVIVPSGSTWKYWHPTEGTDPADDDPDFHETFANLDYDDAHWPSGKDSGGPTGGFGYGDNAGVAFEQPAQANRLTAYFRCAFETDEPREDLRLHLQRDDGVIVYLDGREVLRDNVEPGPEAYRLMALRTISGNDERRVRVFRLPGQLKEGKHVLAISLHNREGGSSDLRIAEISLRGTPVTKASSATDTEQSK